MSEFQTVKKKGLSTSNSIKYADSHQKLLEMGFDSSSVTEALENANGNLEAATALLLGDSSAAPIQTAATKPAPVKPLPAKQAVTTPKAPPPKPDIKETHNKFMATYKVQKCKEKLPHDKRMCIFWHTKGDRRRNPFEISYTCSECPNSTETSTCEAGDNCLKAHNMLERMFHPDLFKISMCQRGPNGAQCERGNLCAFAHSEEDHRIPFSFSLSKAAAAAAAANAAPPTVVIAPAPAAGNNSNNSSSAATNSDSMQPSKLMSDSRLLDEIQEKLVRLIKSQGPEGIISSELPKRYADMYAERLELADEAGEKFRIKDLLLAHPQITFSMHKGVQPKYVYEEDEKADGTSDVANGKEGAPKASSASGVSTMSYAGAISNNRSKTTAAAAAAIASDDAAVADKDGLKLRLNLGLTVGGDGFYNPMLGSSSSSADALGGFLDNKSPAAGNGSAVGVGGLDYSAALTGTLNGTSNGSAAVTTGQAAAAPIQPVGSRRGKGQPEQDVKLATPNNAPASDLNARLENAAASNSALRQQVTGLQNELELKTHELDVQSMKLRSAMQQLSDFSSATNGTSSDSSAKEAALENARLKGEFDALKIKMFEKEAEVSMKLDEVRKRDSLVQQLKAEKLQDLTNHRNNLAQIENILIDIQRKESVYINEISLHDTINESSRARDELTKYVNMLKAQANAKIVGDTAAATKAPSSVGSYLSMNGTTASVGSDIFHGMDAAASSGGGFAGLGGSLIRPASGSYAQSLLHGTAGASPSLSSFLNNDILRMDEGIGKGILGGGGIENSFMMGGAAPSTIGIAPLPARMNILRCSLPGCMNEGSFICSACGKAGYCGPDHQSKHWAQHINDCSV